MRTTLLSALLFCTLITDAQTRYIYFKDDFAGYPTGSFPKNWKRNKQIYQSDAQVRNQNGMSACFIEKHASITPIKTSLSALGDTFSVEYRFKMDNPKGSASIAFANETNGVKFSAYGNGVIIFDSKSSTINKQYTGEFSYTEWHKIRVSYTNAMLDCSIDTIHLFTSAQFTHSMELAIWLGGSIAITDFYIQSVREIAEFRDITVGKKLVTHAINFDKGKSTISTTSEVYIENLATWLRQHVEVKLEIDGHTDTDGNVDSNRNLSLQRAENIKASLIKNGVSITRLTTKGLGADNPVDMDTTARAKAANRRVEFISL